MEPDTYPGAATIAGDVRRETAPCPAQHGLHAPERYRNATDGWRGVVALRPRRLQTQPCLPAHPLLPCAPSIHVATRSSARIICCQQPHGNTQPVSPESPRAAGPRGLTMMEGGLPCVADVEALTGPPYSAAAS